MYRSTLLKLNENERKYSIMTNKERAKVLVIAIHNENLGQDIPSKHAIEEAAEALNEEKKRGMELAAELVDQETRDMKESFEGRDFKVEESPMGKKIRNAAKEL